MKTSKRILAALLALMLVLSLAACAKTPASSTASTESKDSTSQTEKSYYNKEGLPICDETITIKVSGQNYDSTNWADTYFVKHTGDRYGIQWDVNPIEKDAWENQFALMLSTDEIPDLIVGSQSDKALINGYGDDGFFLDMNKYKDLMPNLWKYFEKFPDFAGYSQTADGKLYGLGSMRSDRISCAMGYGWIKNSWLDKVGMKAPTTIDELYKVLVAFRDQDANGNGDPNDEIPMSITIGRESAQRVDWMLKAAFGMISINANYMLYEGKDGKVGIYDTTDNYRSYLTWLNKLWEENLLDHQTFTQTTAELEDKIRSDRTGLTGDWSDLTYALNVNDQSCWYDYTMFTAFTSEYVDHKTYTLYPSNSGGCRYFIGAKTKYPEAICRMTDDFYTDEGRIFMSSGEEGKTFDWKIDSFGTKSPAAKAYAEKAGLSIGEFAKTVSLVNPLWTSGLPTKALKIIASDDATLDKMIAEGAEDYYTWSAMMEKELRKCEVITSFPFLVYDSETASKYSSLNVDITNYLKQTQTEFINGETKLTDENWNKYLKKLDEMGLQTMLEIDQKAYDNYKAALK